jgi:hypothetical protein
MKRFGIRCAALAWTLGVGVAIAEPRDPAAAELLFREARKALDAGRTEEACSKFAESQRLDPAPGTLINLAACREKLGQLASAWETWQQALRTLPPQDERRPGVEGRAAALESRVPRLEIRLAEGAPPDAKVVRDGIELGPAALGLPIPVDPGLHRVEVRAPGRAAKSYEVTVAESETKALVVDAGAALPPETQPAVTPPPKKPPPPKPVRPEPERTASDDGTLGWIVLGVGAAGIVVGSVAGLLAIQKKNEMEDDCTSAGEGFECGDRGFDAADSGKTFATVSTIAFAVGAVGVGLGGYLVLSSDSGSETAFVGLKGAF